MLLKQIKQRVRQIRLRRAKVQDNSRWDLSAFGGWSVWPDAIHRDSIVYSFGVGTDIGWDLEMIERFGVTIHAFDPTPESIAWVRQQPLPREFVFHDYGISNFDGTIDFYPPRRADNPHYSQDKRGGIFDRRPPVPGQVFRLESIMKRLGHQRIDVLKLDVEGSEFEAIPDLIQSGIEVDQLLVEIHYQFPSRSFQQGLDLIGQLKRYGMQCAGVSQRGYEFVFVREGIEEAAPSIRRVG